MPQVVVLAKSGDSLVYNDKQMFLIVLLYVVKYVILLVFFLILSLRNKNEIKNLRSIINLIFQYSVIIIFIEILHIISNKVICVVHRPNVELIAIMIINPLIVAFMLILGLLHAIMLILFCKHFIYKYGCFGIIGQWFLSFIFIDDSDIQQNCNLVPVIIIINKIGRIFLLLELFIIELVIIKQILMIIIQLL